MKFGKFVKDEYAPKGRPEPGMWSLPDGDARYARERQGFDHDRSDAGADPSDRPARGTRIEGQMAELAKKLGFADVKALNAAIEADPSATSTRARRSSISTSITSTRCGASFPSCSRRLPKARIEVVAVAEFREKGAPGAEYDTGAPDGSRPGRVECEYRRRRAPQDDLL